ncbi:phosphatase domain-containing protein [uncultured Serinicoccus sp.]|uniref:phosphatase domain-containing protein n=1 Tax=uncultured Serinicoccus sp. TaxID=735514 RepID=UPI002616C1A4|nr:phosphatase domain-containing protein [uncultured Serinicoccus sp.]
MHRAPAGGRPGGDEDGVPLSATVPTELLARLIGPLHRGRVTREDQEAIVDTLTTLEGAAFHDLKYRLNATGDHHDLEHLVFDHLDDDLQDVVLEHIAAQATQHPSSDLRVLCDIDDTVRSAIHDDRFPRGTVYPGVVTLLTELDRGATADPGRVGDLTFVTARPGGPLGLVEQYTRDDLSELGMPTHTVLGGSLLNLHTKNAIAERKLQNMERDHLLFPESRMVFIGDSGQADGDVGAEMAARPHDHVVGTLLHDVTGLDAAARAAWADQRVHVFDTYVGAAAHAVRLGLLSPEQGRTVAGAVQTELGALQLEEGQADRVAALLEADLATLGSVSRG